MLFALKVDLLFFFIQFNFLIVLLLLPVLIKVITVLFSENLSRKSFTTTPLPAVPSATYASPYFLKSYVDSVERALIGSSNSEYPVLFTSEQLAKKWRPSLHP